MMPGKSSLLGAAERPPPSLRINFRWSLAGSLVYSFCQWGMLSVLAKRGDATTVGTFALALAISSPVFIFTNLTLRAVQVTDAQQQFCFADYFTVRAFTTLAGLLTVIAVAASLHSAPRTAKIVMLVAVARSIECISDIVGGLFQTEERLDLAAVSQMARGGLSLLCFGAAFLLSQSLIVSSAALGAAWLIVLIAYDLPRARALLGDQFFFNRDWAPKRRLGLLSLPLGVVMLLVSLNGNIPRYLLVHFAGPAELGIFASLAYLLVAVSMVVNALGQAATVRLSLRYAAGELQSFRQLVLKLVFLGILITVIGLPLAAAFGRPLLLLFYRPEYAAHMSVFLVMVAAAGVGAIASFLGYGLTATRCFNAQLPLTAASAFTVAVTTALLVPGLGILGAALALLTSSVVLVVGYAWLLSRTLRAAMRLQSEADPTRRQQTVSLSASEVSH
jgi:O-antigen/teichoic acid export membrane protein